MAGGRSIVHGTPIRKRLIWPTVDDGMTREQPRVLAVVLGWHTFSGSESSFGRGSFGNLRLPRENIIEGRERETKSATPQGHPPASTKDIDWLRVELLPCRETGL